MRLPRWPWTIKRRLTCSTREKAGSCTAIAMCLLQCRGWQIRRHGQPQCESIARPGVRTLKDATGKAFGQALYDAGQKPEGEITEVEYLFARPTDPKPVPKTTFVTRVGEIACGVGYYK